MTTYVTPATSENPRASQVPVMDLSTAQPVVAPIKRPPTSPRKSKSPAKRRNVAQVEDSDDYDDDNYMDILDAEDAMAKVPASSPLKTSKYFDDAGNTDAAFVPESAIAPPRSSAHDEPPKSPTPRSMKAISQEEATKKELFSSEPMIPPRLFSPTIMLDTANPPPYDITPKSMSINSPAQTSFKTQLIADLQHEYQSLKASMLDIVLDESRGKDCEEGRANSARRAQIEAQIAQLSAPDKATLERQLGLLNSKIVTEYALAGRPIPDALKLELSQLQEQIRIATEGTPVIHALTRTNSMKLTTTTPSRLNSIAGKPAISTTLHSSVPSHKTNVRLQEVAMPAESHQHPPPPPLQQSDSNIIELSDDEDDFTKHMGHAVDFDEADFSDGVDYVAEPVHAESYRQSAGRNHKTIPQLPPMGRQSTSNSRVHDKVSASPSQRQPMFRPEPSQTVLQTQDVPSRPVDLMSLPGMKHPWSADVARVLKETFKLHAFRSNQLEAINATLSGRDVFVLMPTGGGKSLCYQLPSVIQSGSTSGLTVVVSPLVSLMQDQVDHLEAIGIRATAYNGEKTQAEKGKIRTAINQGQIDCLYVTPELLALSDHVVEVFQDLRRKRKLARIVIDEAHCVSQWGHDFRPDYKKLGDFRSKFLGVPVIALTATANDQVQVDVKDHLKLNNPACFRQSFNRPNLHYHVYPRTSGVIDKIKSLIRDEHNGQVGIIYCISKRDCEKLADQIPGSAFYHAGMEKKDRAHVQRAWQLGEINIICATIAFGMGIDKANVRFVIHHSLPKSLEGYYQETGRAGRDGKTAMCYLFWSFSDRTTLFRMIDKPSDSGVHVSFEQKKNMKEGIQRVIDYADNKADCRRKQVLGFFNEHFDVKDCHRTCDNCQSGQVYTEQDVSDAAKIAVRITRAIQESAGNDKDSRATLNDCVVVARGGAGARITSKGWDRIDGFAGLKADSHWDVANTTKLFQHLVSIGVLQDKHVTNPKGFVNTYCVPGPQANAVVAGRTSVQMRVQTPRAKKSGTAKQRTASRQSNSDDIVDDDMSGFLDPPRAAAPPAFPQLDQYRCASSSSGSMRPPTKSRRPDTREDILAAMYKRPFTTLDSDRIDRCIAELRQLRDKLQKSKGHKRNETTFDNAVIQEISVHLPCSIAQMKSIRDIRMESIDEYGFQVLTITNKYKEEETRLRPLLDQRPNYAEPYFNQEAENDEEDFNTDNITPTDKKRKPRPKQKPKKSSQTRTQKRIGPAKVR